MKTYTAFFRTEALALARAFCDEHAECLMFQGNYGGQPFNEIDIVISETTLLAVWRDDVVALGGRARSMRSFHRQAARS